jgi:hypothetical protein
MYVLYGTAVTRLLYFGYFNPLSNHPQERLSNEVEGFTMVCMVLHGSVRYILARVRYDTSYWHVALAMDAGFIE